MHPYPGGAIVCVMPFGRLRRPCPLLWPKQALNRTGPYVAFPQVTVTATGRLA